MLGAIAGDIIGSVYEGFPIRKEDFPLFGAGCSFTDDTVLTIATADCLLNKRDYRSAYVEYGRQYPGAGFGGSFIHWIFSDKPKPYYSWGNGAAMRVSPVGFACQSLEGVLREAKKSAEVSHNHPEGVKGAQATAAAVYLARTGKNKDEIKKHIQDTFAYDLSRTLADIRPDYHFDVSCQGSVPESIISFLESESVEDAIRKAVSLGGDSDTMACIAGGIAHAYYKNIPQHIVEEVAKILPSGFKTIVKEFESTFMNNFEKTLR